MMKYALGIGEVKPDVKIFFREHNIEYSLVEQFGKFIRNPIYKAIAKWQAEKSKRMEVKYWEEANRVFFISDTDYEIALSIAPQLSDKFRVIYDGYEIKHNDVTQVGNSDFIYTANLNTIQNEMSFRWFLEKVWIPNLQFLKSKNIKIYITGNSEDVFRKKLGKYESIEELNIKNLGFLGDVDEEIRKYKYVLSPTVIGSGIRLKLLNGMACGKPVFATPLDMKTTKYFKDMENIVCFEDGKSFIKKLVSLENNKDLYISISKNALETVSKYFSWEKYAEDVYTDYLEITRERK
ncbi:MAG: glycosyltransferase [Geminocystis sp.]|nr:glycosyltransferase [Geminocystis sp.]